MGLALIAGTLGIFLMSAVPVRAADAPAAAPAPAAAADKTMTPSATDKPVVTQKKHKAAKKTGVKSSKKEHKTGKHKKGSDQPESNKETK